MFLYIKYGFKKPLFWFEAGGRRYLSIHLSLYVVSIYRSVIVLYLPPSLSLIPEKTRKEGWTNLPVLQFKDRMRNEKFNIMLFVIWGSSDLENSIYFIFCNFHKIYQFVNTDDSNILTQYLTFSWRKLKNIFLSFLNDICTFSWRILYFRKNVIKNFKQQILNIYYGLK